MFLALNAAIEGAGVVIADLNLVVSELEAGILVAPFPMVFKSPEEYYFVTYPGRENPLAELFRDWIKTELARNQASFEIWETWSHRPDPA
jgi:DNA-binding transcriptional LysR family regulator